ncbi:MAG: hypothetical protein OHK93_003025 [Ramalina farinacea]|uniref:Aminoglycoside phosphotransferase domain-containing protein n=1 Tax=Ramalina farinacea TaxID=258253 RepID=A0AA43QUA9_9LECA|nr:hypothetical protein [Ramalina farinacea]
MDLTTVPKISAYLTSRNIAFEDLRLLSGGSCNFVFRLTPTDPQASRDASHSGITKTTLILKHAQPYTAQNPNHAFPTSRMDLEHVVLTTLTQLLPSNQRVAPVRVKDYDAENHVLTIHDGGTDTLKAAYVTLDTETIQRTGGEVATWLSQLHTSTVKPTDSIASSSWWRTWDNDHLSKSIYRFSYNAIGPTLSQHGYGEEGRRLGERINEIYGAALRTDDEAICHGDFWPGNVLLNLHPHMSATATIPHLTIVDFEMSRRGNPATDVAQFAAEAWLLDTFRGSKGLLPAFLERYGEFNRVEVERVVVHMGAHLVCWPARLGGAWGDGEGVKECVRLGRELLLSGLGEGEVGLENALGGVLRVLLP